MFFVVVVLVIVVILSLFLSAIGLRGMSGGKC